MKVRKICNQLPGEGNYEEIILLKFTDKLSFKIHVYFEPVRPKKVKAALVYIQRVNSIFILCCF